MKSKIAVTEPHTSNQIDAAAYYGMLLYKFIETERTSAHYFFRATTWLFSRDRNEKIA